MIPIDGVLINFGSTYEDFEQKRSELKRQYRINYNRQESRAFLQMKFSMESSSAYKACLKQVGIYLTARDIDDDGVNVDLNYTSPPGIWPPLEVTLSGNGLKGSATKFITVAANGSQGLTLTRPKTQSLRVVANSKDGKYHDSIFLPKLPAITRPTMSPITYSAMKLDADSKHVARTTDEGNPNIHWGECITNVGEGNQYNRAVWIVPIPTTANYQFEVEFAAKDDPRPVQVQLDGNVWKLVALKNETTGSWDCRRARWASLGIMTLTAGDHTIWIEREAAIPHIRNLRFTPLQ